MINTVMGCDDDEQNFGVPIVLNQIVLVMLQEFSNVPVKHLRRREHSLSGSVGTLGCSMGQ